MQNKKYCYFFDIDEDFYKVVDQHLIESGAVDWRKFLPHETFVKLIETTIKVLTRTERLSIWVEGGYGTGKSYAVLTLKKLLEASEEETRAYFDKYNLSMDLCNRLEGIKGQGNIITVHRYGAQSITNEQDLLFAIQESILNALKEKNIEPGNTSLKDSVIRWLSNDSEAAYFDSLIKTEYRILFGGDTVSGIIDKLNNYKGEQLDVLMGKITRVAHDKHMTLMQLSKENLVQWIKDIITKHELKAIVFIWDEFTKFFQNNMSDLTTFQYLVELSESAPFYFIIVTHVSEGLFAENDNDKKIIDRFVRPTCLIELPDAMAFRLLAMSMEKAKGEGIAQEWEDVVKDLADRTEEPRRLVLEQIQKTDRHFSDQDMQNILPIHPYAAILLKYLSAKFASNQRSMFDFIKNNTGEDVHGFQWFIRQFSPYDDDGDNQLLTVDMLWNFFYDNGKDQLSKNVRSILDHYEKSNPESLTIDQQRVLKTVLLLSAVSDTLDNKFDLLLPTDTNIRMAFTGLDRLDPNHAYEIVRGFVETEHILYIRKGKDKREYYVPAISEIDRSKKTEFEKGIDEWKTTRFVQEAGFGTEDTLKNKHLRLVFQSPLPQRFDFSFVGSDAFQTKIRQIRDMDLQRWKIPVVLVFSKTDTEISLAVKIIKDSWQSLDSDIRRIIYVNVKTPLGEKNYTQFKEYMSNSMVYEKNDNASARAMRDNALDVLNSAWGDEIQRGSFEVDWVSKEGNHEHENISGFQNLGNYLMTNIGGNFYPYSFETKYQVNAGLYKSSTNVATGVKSALEGKCIGVFNSQTRPTEKLLEGAWKMDPSARYWEQNPGWNISRLKKAVEEKIKESIEKEGRVSIREIYDVAESAPFGVMPCNLTGFILGFVLRDYAGEPYGYTDNISSTMMSGDQLSTMISDVIKDRQNPSKKYVDKYIVAKTEQEKEFQNLAVEVFAVPDSACVSVQSTRTELRNRVKNLEFPLWTLEYVLKERHFDCEDALREIIQKIFKFMNSGDESDVSICKEIGEISLTNIGLNENLEKLVSKENCRLGMDIYLHQYKDGELITLAEEVEYKHEKKAYLDKLHDRLQEVDASIWLWNKDTIDECIESLIAEYSMTAGFNAYFNETCHSGEETLQNWQRRCDSFRIPFVVIRNSRTELADLMQYLEEIKKTNSTTELMHKKFYCSQFYGCFQKVQNEFRIFLDEERELFKEVNSFVLSDLNTEGVDKIYRSVGNVSGVCLLSRNDYLAKIEEMVNEYKSRQKKVKLESLWKEKTGTRDPITWSEMNRTPILVMISADKREQAKKMFRCFDASYQANDQEIEDALKFLTGTDFFANLNNKACQDEAFSKYILKEYSAILPDPDEIREYLYKKNPYVYEWYSNDVIDGIIKEYADHVYITVKHRDVVEIIATMDDAKLKKYLVNLAKENTILGIQILKNKG